MNLERALYLTVSQPYKKVMDKELYLSNTHSVLLGNLIYLLGRDFNSRDLIEKMPVEAALTQRLFSRFVNEIYQDVSVIRERLLAPFIEE